jgi:predicted TIM-barrel fold metal-dependent hydrolase
MHAHTAWTWAKGSWIRISESIRNSYKFPIYLKAFWVSKEELREEWDAIVFRKISERLKASEYVDSSVILAMDWFVGSDNELDLENTEIYIPNEFVYKETSKYDNLYFWASVNPNRLDAIERLEKVHGQWAILIKWLPSIMNIDPSSEKNIPFYNKLIELDIPLLVHIWDEHSFTKADNSLSQPEKLELPLSMGVKVIAAHVWTLWEKDNVRSHDRLINMFRKYPNLYADISSLTQINKMRFLKEILSNNDLKWRLLYGSDMPLINTALVSPLYYISQITIAQIYDILSTDNIYDKDVKLKYAIWVGEDIFIKPKEFFNINK